MFVHKSELGITIIEALIALLILGMLVSSVTLVHQHSFKVTTESRIRTVAVNLARQKLESLKHLDNSGNDRNSSTWTTITKQTEKPKVKGIEYKVTTTIPTTNNTNSKFKPDSIIPLRVTVEWEYNGREQSLSMETCYMQYLTE